MRILALPVLLSASAFLMSGSVDAQDGEAPSLRVRIETAAPLALARELESSGYDVLQASGRGALELVVTDRELEALQHRGLPVQVLEHGRPLPLVLREREGQEAAVPSGYRDLAGILARMQEIAAARPGIARFVDLTTTFGTPATVEGRHLFALKISDNVSVDEDEPAVLIVGTHHAREITVPVIALDAAERLVTGYGSDSRITAAVDGNQIWIAPVWNPDGYNHVFTADNLWRKNRRVFSSGIGVDQNRNYPQGWNSRCAGSTTVGSGSYKGPAAGSEAETRTMMAWSRAVRFAKVVDFHSTGRETLYAYRCLAHPFTSWMRDEAIGISRASSYGGTIRLPSAEGEHPQWQFAQQGAYAFLTETQTQFQPPFAGAVSEAARVWPGILRVLERPIVLSGHVTDAVGGAPVAATIAVQNVTFANGETNSSGGAFGVYHFFGPSGTYRLRFSAPGFVSRTQTVTLDSSAARVLNLQLSRATNATGFGDDSKKRNAAGDDVRIIQR
jgi:carboxypeptidase T